MKENNKLKLINFVACEHVSTCKSHFAQGVKNKSSKKALDAVMSALSALSVLSLFSVHARRNHFPESVFAVIINYCCCLKQSRFFFTTELFLVLVPFLISLISLFSCNKNRRFLTRRTFYKLLSYDECDFNKSLEKSLKNSGKSSGKMIILWHSVPVVGGFRPDSTGTGTASHVSLWSFF